MKGVSVMLFLSSLALFGWHRFSRKDRSDIAVILLLGSLLPSGIAFGQIVDENKPSGPRLAIQLLVLAAGIGLHIWTRQGPDRD